jgi:YegS/Rv2252/BmrU family lipid kinase
VAREFRAQGWTVDVAESTAPGHAARLAVEAVARGASRVIAVGGDGTVHEVANGLLAATTKGEDTVTLGVVPIGSGNDFAKLLGVYRHAPERAVACLCTARQRRFDVGRALDEWFVNSLGFGFGPAVVRLRNGMPGLRGFLSYLVPVLRAFATYRAPRLEVRAAEHRETGEMMMVEVCNGTTAGGDYRFAPDADPADGRLDVCLVRRVSLPRFLLAVPRVMRGTHGAMREVALYQTRSVTVRCAEAPLLLHLDGELKESGLHEVTVTLEPKRLTVLVAR